MLAAAAAALAGCGGTSAPAPISASARTRSVVAAFYPLAYAAQQVGGSRVRVRDLTPAGAEPHDLELGAAGVREILGADLVVYLGGGFMPALEDALRSRRGPSLDVLRDGRLLAAPPGPGGGADPHVWLDPLRYAGIARAIARALGDAAAAGPFAARLRALDRELRRGLARCARRDLVTSHAAFGYLVARYGLRQVPLQGLAPAAEPSGRALERLVAQVERTGATTVFVEPLVSPRLARTVAREAGVRTAVLNPLEGLTSAERARGADYFSLMRANLAALRRALACR